MEFNPIAFNLENTDRHLLDYLPPFMQQVQEFQAINAANEPEIKAAWQSVSRVLSNQFMAEADAQGLAVWERELGIFAKDTDTLALRRARILAAWQRQPPYTIRWLRAWLDSICGTDNYTANVQAYTLNIQLNHDRLPDADVLLGEIKSVLQPLRPANILLETAEVLKLQQLTVYGGGALWGNISCTELPKLDFELPMRQNISIAGKAESIMLTPLPEIESR